jgi:hypothetical protein
MSTTDPNEQPTEPLHTEHERDELDDAELESIRGGGPMNSGFERPP